EPLPETLERRVQELAPAVGRDAGLDALPSRAPEPQLRVGAERALVLEIEAPRAAGEWQSGSPGAPRGVDERLREALAVQPRGEPRGASRERLRCGPAEQRARQELQVLGMRRRRENELIGRTPPGRELGARLHEPQRLLARERSHARGQPAELIEELVPAEPCLLPHAVGGERPGPPGRRERGGEALRPQARRGASLAERCGGARELCVELPRGRLKIRRHETERTEEVPQAQPRHGALAKP